MATTAPSLASVTTEKKAVLPLATSSTLQNRYRACMVLAAVGDALGYKNGNWEFNTSGLLIHEQYRKLTQNKGMPALKIDLSWRVSDDTIMHIATAKALAKASTGADVPPLNLFVQLGREYKECWKQMAGRAPGKTCGKAMKVLEANGANWNRIPFADRSCGCGAAMRAACIGLRYRRPEDLHALIAVSVEAGRMTHHNPVGYMGSYVAALFTAYALQGIPFERWGELMMNSIPQVENYLRESRREVESNLSRMKNFVTPWRKYLRVRGIESGNTAPTFPSPYGVLERDRFYRSVSHSGWGGSAGYDSVMIAYDALLGCKGNWVELCERGALHGGDNDSTGTIAAAWFGAMNGFATVPRENHAFVEFSRTLVSLADSILKISPAALSAPAGPLGASPSVSSESEAKTLSTACMASQSSSSSTSSSSLASSTSASTSASASSASAIASSTSASASSASAIASSTSASASSASAIASSSSSSSSMTSSFPNSNIQSQETKVLANAAPSSPTLAGQSDSVTAAPETVTQSESPAPAPGLAPKPPPALVVRKPPHVAAARTRKPLQKACSAPKPLSSVPAAARRRVTRVTSPSVRNPQPGRTV